MDNITQSSDFTVNELCMYDLIMNCGQVAVSYNSVTAAIGHCSYSLDGATSTGTGMDVSVQMCRNSTLTRT